MKIIISNYDDIANPYYGGGGAIAIHQVAKRLAKNHDIEIITGKYPGSKNTIIDKVVYKRVGFGLLGPYFGMLSFSFSLPFIALKKNYDIWLESFTPPFSTGFLPLFTNKPVLAVVHMLSADDMKRKYKLPFDWIEKVGLKLYSNFIVTSEVSKKKIMKANPNANFNIIPNGVNIPKNEKSIGKHILYLGRIEIEQKGIDLLLQAQKEIYKKTKTKLVIAGTGNLNEVTKLKQLIKVHGLENEVDYIGKIKGTKWEWAYRNAKIVVLPSRFDTYPLVALEAASFSKPLVKFDIENLNWIPRDVALSAKSFDSDSLAETIIYILKNENLRKKMGLKAFKFAKEKSWKNISKKYLSVIEKTV